MTELARQVVYRHPCHCAGASRPLEDGEQPEHRFDIDGAPFPWHITEEGPTFTQLEAGLFGITVTIIAENVDSDAPIAPLPVQYATVDLGDDPDGDLEGYDGP